LLKLRIKSPAADQQDHRQRDFRHHQHARIKRPDTPPPTSRPTSLNVSPGFESRRVNRRYGAKNESR
jgi:hypothetical protein